MPTTDDGVLVEWPLAAVLSRRLRRLVTEDARRNATLIPREVLALLDEFDRARLAIEQVAGTADADRAPGDRYRQVESVDVTTYATATGRSPRSVRRSCERKTLPAWKDERGEWRIENGALQCPK